MTHSSIDKTAEFQRMRARLTSIVARMLASRAEAEDVVQEVWLKWQAADAAALHTPPAWLTIVATRLALDRLRRLAAERAARESEWIAEPWRDEFAPSAEEAALKASSLDAGLMLLVERLSPDERAAFVLHEAFDCDYASIADFVGKTPAHCRQLVHRARERLHREPDRAGRRGADEPRRGTLDRLSEALETGDVALAMQVFTATATLSIDGREALRANAETPIAAAATTAMALVEESRALGGGTVCAHPLAIDGAGYLALSAQGEIVALVAVSFADMAIGHVEITTDGAIVAAMNRAFGRHAVEALLAAVRQQAFAALPVA